MSVVILLKPHERALDDGWALDEPPSRPVLMAVPAAPPAAVAARTTAAIDDGWTIEQPGTLPPLPPPPPVRQPIPSLVAVPRAPTPAPLAINPRQGSAPPAFPLPPPPESYPGFSCDEDQFFAAGDDLTIAAVAQPLAPEAPSRLRRFRTAVRRVVATIWPIDP